MLRDLGVLVGKVSLGGRDERRERGLVGRRDVLDGDRGGRLLVDDCSETGLVLDNDVRDTHLAAEGREEDDELDRVDVVGDDDQVGLLGLDKGDDVVQAVLDKVGLLVGLLVVGRLVAGGDLGLSLGQEPGLLLLLRLRLVLVEEREELGGRVLVERVGELGDRRGNLRRRATRELLRRGAAEGVGTTWNTARH